MFCEFCGNRLEAGAVLCPACGHPSPAGPRAPEAARTFTPEPAPVLLEGPSCLAHPGYPQVGACPRCGKQVCVRCAPEAASDDLVCTDCRPMSQAHRLPPPGAQCAAHPEAKAAFICARCGAFACAQCTPPGDTRGLCLRCAPSLGAKATRGARFLAALVDNLVIGLPPIAAVVLFAAANGSQSPVGSAAVMLAGFGAFLLGVVLQLAAQLRWGQSVGKRLVRIKVVRTDGRPVELWRLLLLRNFVVLVLSNLCGLVGLVDVLLIFTEDQRCLHDHLAGTVVIDLGPRE